MSFASRALAMLLTGVLFVACQPQEQEEAAPQTSDPVVMVMWEKAGSPPRVLQAGDVEQQTAGAATVTTFEEVMLRIPLADGEMVITAPQASLNEGDGLITFVPPIHLAGSVEGRPLQGRSRSGAFQTKHMVLTMREVEWIHYGQWFQVATLTLQDDWQSRIAQQPSARRAPFALTASQSALPYPLELPQFRREMIEQ